MSRDERQDLYTFEFPISRAGAFEYAVVYQDEKSSESYSRDDVDKMEKLGKSMFYFLVDSLLTIGSRNGGEKGLLHLDAICLLTVVPKWLGPMREWINHWPSISDTGYNMIHFVPLMKRGGSNSPYSIYDQLSLSDDLFEQGLDDNAKFALLKKELQSLEDDHKILSITDVVWNHTAHNSKWLKSHPDAGYNLVNSSHLRAAFDVDEALQTYRGDRGATSTPLQTEADLKRVMNQFKAEVLPGLKLWEYYAIDVKSHLAEIEAMCEEISSGRQKYPTDESIAMFEHLRTVALQKQAVSVWEKSFELPRGPGLRNGKRLNISVCFAAIAAIFPQYRSNVDTAAIVKFLQDLVNEMNLQFYKEYDVDIALMLNNLTQRIQYERVAAHGPRLGDVNAENPLATSYFTRLAHPEGEDFAKYVVANNGWIWNADPLVDFAGPGSKSYFVREVIPVSLNYLNFINFSGETVSSYVMDQRNLIIHGCGNT